MKTFIYGFSLVLTLNAISPNWAKNWFLYNTYDVHISAFADASLDKKTYILLPSDKNKVGIECDAYARYIKNGLSNNYTEVTDAIADMAILFDYGISDPQQETSSYVKDVSHYDRTTGSFKHTPIAMTETSTTYTRYITLTAIDYKLYKKTKEIKEVWSVKIKSEGSSGELRDVFVYMIVGSYEFFGKNISQTVMVKEKDPRVVFVGGN